jgi:hypothetical protein
MTCESDHVGETGTALSNRSAVDEVMPVVGAVSSCTSIFIET